MNDFYGLALKRNRFRKDLRTKTFINEMYLINGFGQASPSFGSDPPTRSDQAQGSPHG